MTERVYRVAEGSPNLDYGSIADREVLVFKPLLRPAIGLSVSSTEGQVVAPTDGGVSKQGRGGY